MNGDSLLVERALHGETEAFKKLITSYYPGLYGFLIRMGIPETRAVDLAQAIFLDAFRNLYRYNDRWSFSTWFYRLAYRMTRRDKQRHPEVRASLPDIPDFLLKPEEKPDQQESLNAMLDPIHDEDRAMLILHYANGLPLREIGRIFGLSVSSARMRMDRAAAFLAENIPDAERPQSRAVSLVIDRIKKAVPLDAIPAKAIISLAEKEAGSDPGFLKRATSPKMLRKIWPIAVPTVLALLLIGLLCIQDVSKPFWDSVMTIFDKGEEPVSVGLPLENTSTPVNFTPVSGLSSGEDLVEWLNETGMDETPWQVLHASAERVIIRNSHALVSCGDGEFRQLVDLDSFWPAGAQGAELSISPTGAFMVAGTGETDEAYPGKGVYLFDLSDGSYYRISESSADQVAYAWSSSGNYLAYAGREGGGTVYLLDLQAQELHKMETGAPIASLFVSNSGGVGVFTGNQVMTASVGDDAWKSENVQHEPFCINPDSGVIWSIQNGSIIRHDMGSTQDIAVIPDSGTSGGESQDTSITDYRMDGNCLIFRMKNGNSGTMNMRTAKVNVFHTSRELKAERLPWCRATASGARVMFNDDGAFLIVSESSVTTPRIPGYSTLKPDQTSWADEENIAYVRLVNEEDPQAGELSIYTINVLTGAVTEVFRSVDKDFVLKTDEAGPASTVPSAQSASGETDRIYETDKATGSRVESFVTKTCKVKNGPGDSYADIGEIKQNEIIVYNNREVNSWCLAQKVSGMLSEYDTRNAFWIRAENIHSYDRSDLPAGIITADKVRLSKISLSKGNLIRIIVQGDQKSYVMPYTTDKKLGITGWISNDSFTRDLNGIYYDPYLPGSTGTSSASAESQQFDLNGDGIADGIRFTTDGRKYTLTVNQSKAEGQGSGVQSEYRLVDIDPMDPYYEIVIEENGNNPMSTFYYYNGQRLIHMGKAEGLCGNTEAVKGDGTIRSKARSSILETWHYTKEYLLNAQHKLVESPRAFYEKIGYKSASPLRLKVEALPFALSPGSDEISFVLNRNESVRFVGSDNQRWCLFQTIDGRNGWLEVYDSRYIAGTGMAAPDVFDGLVLAE